MTTPPTKTPAEMKNIIFAGLMDDMSFAFHDLACRNGFWPHKDRGITSTPEYGLPEYAMRHALINTELGEATEALRKGNPPDDHLPDYPQELVEMADIIIRIGDYCAARYPNTGDPNAPTLGRAVVAKHEYNKSRPRKHGKEF